MLKQKAFIHYKRIFLLAYPICFSELGTVLTGVADSAMVGRSGAVPLAASSLANSIFIMFLMFATGVSFGITQLVSIAAGKKDLKESTQVLKHGVIINTTISVCLFLLLYMGAPIMRFAEQPREVVEMAIPYFRILAVSIIPYMIFQALRQFMEGLSFTQQTMYIGIMANLINIGLNYLLIYGNGGFPTLGLNGAGLATLISRIFMPIGMVIIALYIPQTNFCLKEIRLTNLSVFQAKRILKIGIPVGMQFIFQHSAFAFSTIMMGWLGVHELAAHQIALSLANVTYMVIGGISAAAAISVGNQLGMKNPEQLRLAGFSSFMVVIIFMLFCAIVLTIGNKFFPSVFTEDTRVIEIASSLLIITALFQISDGVQAVGMGVLRGIGDVNYPTFITVLAYWGLALPISYILSMYLNLGAQGIWYGLFIGLSASGALLFLRFNKVSSNM